MKNRDVIIVGFIEILFAGMAIFLLDYGVKMKSIETIGTGIFVSFFAILFGILFVSQIKNCIAMIKRKKNRNGWIRCMAKVVSVCNDDTVIVGTQNRQYVECYVMNPITGILMTCTSDKVFEQLDSNPLEEVPVYINPNDPEKYYVAIDEI